MNDFHNQFRNSYHSPNMSINRQDKAVSIYLFKNGDDIYCGRQYKITFQTKNWNNLLDGITSSLPPPIFPVKWLFEADTGQKVTSFTDIKNHGRYVASGVDRFKELPNGYRTRSERSVHRVPSVVHYLPFASSPRENLNNTIIYVFSNGVTNRPARKFVLTKKDIESWDKTLEHIANTLDTYCGDIEGLFTVIGRRVRGPWQLQNGAYYIAVGYHDSFIAAPYMRYYEHNEKFYENLRVDEPLGNKKKNAVIFHGIFRNGDYQHTGNKIITSNIKTFYVLLEEVSKVLKPIDGAIASLYEADSGRKVLSMQNLIHGQRYVATGRERFKKLIGKGYKTSQERQERVKVKPSVIFYKPCGRLPCNTLHTIIFVFPNGQVKNMKKLVLTGNDLYHWHDTLTSMGRRIGAMSGDVSFLYTVTGHVLEGPWQLQNGACYVAVGYYESFKPANYIEYFVKNKLNRGQELQIDYPVGKRFTKSPKQGTHVPGTNHKSTPMKKDVWCDLTNFKRDIWKPPDVGVKESIQHGNVSARCTTSNDTIHPTFCLPNHTRNTFIPCLVKPSTIQSKPSARLENTKHTVSSVSAEDKNPGRDNISSKTGCKHKNKGLERVPHKSSKISKPTNSVLQPTKGSTRPRNDGGSVNVRDSCLSVDSLLNTDCSDKDNNAVCMEVSSNPSYDQNTSWIATLGIERTDSENGHESFKNKEFPFQQNVHIVKDYDQNCSVSEYDQNNNTPKINHQKSLHLNKPYAELKNHRSSVFGKYIRKCLHPKLVDVEYDSLRDDHNSYRSGYYLTNCTMSERLPCQESIFDKPPIENDYIHRSNNTSRLRMCSGSEKHCDFILQKSRHFHPDLSEEVHTMYYDLTCPNYQNKPKYHRINASNSNIIPSNGTSITTASYNSDSGNDCCSCNIHNVHLNPELIKNEDEYNSMSSKPNSSEKNDTAYQESWNICKMSEGGVKPIHAITQPRIYGGSDSNRNRPTLIRQPKLKDPVTNIEEYNNQNYCEIPTKTEYDQINMWAQSVHRKSSNPPYQSGTDTRYRNGRRSKKNRNAWVSTIPHLERNNQGKISYKSSYDSTCKHMYCDSVNCNHTPSTARATVRKGTNYIPECDSHSNIVATSILNMESDLNHVISNPEDKMPQYDQTSSKTDNRRTNNRFETPRAKTKLFTKTESRIIIENEHVAEISLCKKGTIIEPLPKGQTQDCLYSPGRMITTSSNLNQCNGATVHDDHLINIDDDKDTKDISNLKMYASKPATIKTNIESEQLNKLPTVKTLHVYNGPIIQVLTSNKEQDEYPSGRMMISSAKEFNLNKCARATIQNDGNSTTRMDQNNTMSTTANSTSNRPSTTRSSGGSDKVKLVSQGDKTSIQYKNSIAEGHRAKLYTIKNDKNSKTSMDQNNTMSTTANSTSNRPSTTRSSGGSDKVKLGSQRDKTSILCKDSITVGQGSFKLQNQYSSDHSHESQWGIIKYNCYFKTGNDQDTKPESVLYKSSNLIKSTSKISIGSEKSEKLLIVGTPIIDKCSIIEIPVSSTQQKQHSQCLLNECQETTTNYDDYCKTRCDQNSRSFNCITSETSGGSDNVYSLKIPNAPEIYTASIIQGQPDQYLPGRTMISSSKQSNYPHKTFENTTVQRTLEKALISGKPSTTKTNIESDNIDNSSIIRTPPLNKTFIINASASQLQDELTLCRRITSSCKESYLNEYKPDNYQTRPTTALSPFNSNKLLTSITSNIMKSEKKNHRPIVESSSLYNCSNIHLPTSNKLLEKNPSGCLMIASSNESYFNEYTLTIAKDDDRSKTGCNKNNELGIVLKESAISGKRLTKTDLTCETNIQVTASSKFPNLHSFSCTAIPSLQQCELHEYKGTTTIHDDPCKTANDPTTIHDDVCKTTNDQNTRSIGHEKTFTSSKPFIIKTRMRSENNDITPTVETQASSRTLHDQQLSVCKKISATKDCKKLKYEGTTTIHDDPCKTTNDQNPRPIEREKTFTSSKPFIIKARMRSGNNDITSTVENQASSRTLHDQELSVCTNISSTKDCKVQETKGTTTKQDSGKTTNDQNTRSKSDTKQAFNLNKPFNTRTHIRAGDNNNTTPSVKPQASRKLHDQQSPGCTAMPTTNEGKLKDYEVSIAKHNDPCKDTNNQNTKTTSIRKQPFNLNKKSPGCKTISPTKESKLQGHEVATVKHNDPCKTTKDQNTRSTSAPKQAFNLSKPFNTKAHIRSGNNNSKPTVQTSQLNKDTIIIQVPTSSKGTTTKHYDPCKANNDQNTRSVSVRKQTFNLSKPLNLKTRNYFNTYTPTVHTSQLNKKLQNKHTHVCTSMPSLKKCPLQEYEEAITKHEGRSKTMNDQNTRSTSILQKTFNLSKPFTSNNSKVPTVETKLNKDHILEDSTPSKTYDEQDQPSLACTAMSSSHECILQDYREEKTKNPGPHNTNNQNIRYTSVPKKILSLSKPILTKTRIRNENCNTTNMDTHSLYKTPVIKVPSTSILYDRRSRLKISSSKEFNVVEYKWVTTWPDDKSRNDEQSTRYTSVLKQSFNSYKPSKIKSIKSINENNIHIVEASPSFKCSTLRVPASGEQQEEHDQHSYVHIIVSSSDESNLDKFTRVTSKDDQLSAETRNDNQNKSASVLLKKSFNPIKLPKRRTDNISINETYSMSKGSTLRVPASGEQWDEHDPYSNIHIITKVITQEDDLDNQLSCEIRKDNHNSKYIVALDNKLYNSSKPSINKLRTIFRNDNMSYTVETPLEGSINRLRESGRVNDEYYQHSPARIISCSEESNANNLHAFNISSLCNNPIIRVSESGTIMYQSDQQSLDFKVFSSSQVANLLEDKHNTPQNDLSKEGYYQNKIRPEKVQSLVSSRPPTSNTANLSAVEITTLYTDSILRVPASGELRHVYDNHSSVPMMISSSEESDILEYKWVITQDNISEDQMSSEAENNRKARSKSILKQLFTSGESSTRNTDNVTKNDRNVSPVVTPPLCRDSVLRVPASGELWDEFDQYSHIPMNILPSNESDILEYTWVTAQDDLSDDQMSSETENDQKSKCKSILKHIFNSGEPPMTNKGSVSKDIDASPVITPTLYVDPALRVPASGELQDKYNQYSPVHMMILSSEESDILEYTWVTAQDDLSDDQMSETENNQKARSKSILKQIFNSSEPPTTNKSSVSDDRNSTPVVTPPLHTGSVLRVPASGELQDEFDQYSPVPMTILSPKESEILEYTWVTAEDDLSDDQMSSETENNQKARCKSILKHIFNSGEPPSINKSSESKDRNSSPFVTPTLYTDSVLRVPASGELQDENDQHSPSRIILSSEESDNMLEYTWVVTQDDDLSDVRIPSETEDTQKIRSKSILKQLFNSCKQPQTQSCSVPKNTRNSVTLKSVITPPLKTDSVLRVPASGEIQNDDQQSHVSIMLLGSEESDILEYNWIVTKDGDLSDDQACSEHDKKARSNSILKQCFNSGPLQKSLIRKGSENSKHSSVIEDPTSHQGSIVTFSGSHKLMHVDNQQSSSAESNVLQYQWATTDEPRDEQTSEIGDDQDNNSELSFESSLEAKVLPNACKSNRFHKLPTIPASLKSNSHLSTGGIQHDKHQLPSTDNEGNTYQSCDYTSMQDEAEASDFRSTLSLSTNYSKEHIIETAPDRWCAPGSKSVYQESSGKHIPRSHHRYETISESNNCYGKNHGRDRTAEKIRISGARYSSINTSANQRKANYKPSGLTATNKILKWLHLNNKRKRSSRTLYDVNNDYRGMEGNNYSKRSKRGGMEKVYAASSGTSPTLDSRSETDDMEKTRRVHIISRHSAFSRIIGPSYHQVKCHAQGLKRKG